MGIYMQIFRFLCVLSLISFSSCVRNSTETWEDMKTASRYVGRGVDAMWGKDYESRMLTSDEEFVGPYDDEFVPLRDGDLRRSFAGSDQPLSQPKGIPGQKGVPSLSDFYSPSDTLLSVFRAVHFETDEHTVRDKGEVHALLEMAAFLKKNPKTFLVVEGHTDERASASYNIALGMRRANATRAFLVKNGVDQNRIYTVSHGKEHPVVFGHSPDQLKLNRRAEFKIYQR